MERLGMDSLSCGGWTMEMRRLNDGDREVGDVDGNGYDGEVWYVEVEMERFDMEMLS